MATRPRAGSVGAAALLVLGGCVKERCYQDSDCPDGRVCSAQGACVWICSVDPECGEGFRCEGHRCVPRSPGTPLDCPPDMVPVAGLFCVDRYEASRPDATAESPGHGKQRATSRPGVMPWLVPDNRTAAMACEAAGKRLCTPAEWEMACRGPSGTVYGYGNDYDPQACNGIDTFGPGGFHLAPTGTFPRCTNDWGAFDLNGNVWEHVLGGDERTVRGGAYNCSDSRTFHRCDYVPRTWRPSALGFRCCKGPEVQVPDPSPEESPAEARDVPIVQDVAVLEGAGGESGCMPTDTGAESGGPETGPTDVHVEAREVSGDGPGDSVGGGDSGGADPGSGADSSVDGNFGGETGGGPDPGTEADPGSTSDAGGDVPDATPSTDPGTPPSCPEGMARVPLLSGRVVCIDRYEASHADATADSQGTSPVATSRPGVLPWYVSAMNRQALQDFRNACEAAGKRLCAAEEWFEACNGPDDTIYFFGNVWNRETCNSVDAFCDDWCAAQRISPCNTAENCGYQYSCFHVMPTGTFPGCTNPYGLFDVNGNVWEVVPDDSARGYQVRGGAFNCGTPSLRFRCDFLATWDQLFAGFRCCKDLR